MHKKFLNMSQRASLRTYDSFIINLLRLLLSIELMMMVVSNWHFVIRVEIKFTRGHKISGLSVFENTIVEIGNTF